MWLVCANQKELLVLVWRMAFGGKRKEISNAPDRKSLGRTDRRKASPPTLPYLSLGQPLCRADLRVLPYSYLYLLVGRSDETKSHNCQSRHCHKGVTADMSVLSFSSDACDRDRRVYKYKYLRVR